MAISGEKSSASRKEAEGRSASGLITWIYQAEDLDPGQTVEFEKSLYERYSAAAATIDFDFRVLRAGELIPSCLEKPVLRYQGTDLLGRRQCFIVEDQSQDPQGLQGLRAIYRTIQASDSVLLNRTLSGPDYLERDKLALLQHAAGLGIPTPRTIAVPFGRYARSAVTEAVREIGDGPYIVKPREMGMGVAVLKVDSERQLTAAIDIVAQATGGYIVQPFIPHSGDMRVYVADGEVVTSLTRRPRPGDYLANISQGGSAAATDDHRQVADMCRRIAGSLGAEYICIDWLMTEQGPVLNEWSTASAGFTVLPEPGRTQVIEAFFGWIKRTFEKGA
ncbi:hypothetical protein LIX60_03345 [Streptomyces sp. S07_1.15]|uniref:ATP-grasp domain-containing protein n=1 Tax=Streptomyces sp. S07_1.15 TaxID=2873925 RepID=UPI001D15DD40|nr:hypothetical protein [Streptomyces sp. S07_1.15]MCC3650549.1 hypothetical protein [Streptomyces sp. S07_1.15]